MRGAKLRVWARLQVGDVELKQARAGGQAGRQARRLRVRATSAWTTAYL